jgi:hypothetical protein
MLVLRMSEPMLFLVWACSFASCPLSRQSRRFEHVEGTSALPQLRTFVRAGWQVPFVAGPESIRLRYGPFCAQGAQFSTGQRRTDRGQAEGRTRVLDMTNWDLKRDIIFAPADIRLGRAAARLLPPEWLRAACNNPRDLCSHRASSPRTGTSGESCVRRCARCLCP